VQCELGVMLTYSPSSSAAAKMRAGLSPLPAQVFISWNVLNMRLPERDPRNKWGYKKS
jgi:hypothetical protein